MQKRLSVYFQPSFDKGLPFLNDHGIIATIAGLTTGVSACNHVAIALSLSLRLFEKHIQGTRNSGHLGKTTFRRSIWQMFAGTFPVAMSRGRMRKSGLVF